MTLGDRPSIRVGISACLLGHKVRYEGGHRRDRCVTGNLMRYFEWVPVCPELELGLGVPRETLRLEGRSAATRLVFCDSRRDITARMNRWTRRRLEQLDRMNLCGYIFKSGSPSCGLKGLPVHPSGGKGRPRREGVGLFARALMRRFPLLPVEEEGRLHDPAVLDRFVDRVFRYRRLRDVVVPGTRSASSGSRLSGRGRRTVSGWT